MDKQQKTLVALLAILGVFAIEINAKNSMENNLSNSRQVYLSDAAIPVAAFSVSREQKHASRTTQTRAFTLNKFSKYRKQLTDKELKQLLHAVGFRGENLKEAWAVAKKESNGRPRALNNNRRTGDSSYGIFQINMIGDLGPARREKFDLRSNKDLFNPVKNAEIAFYMSQGGKDWSSWHGITSKTKKWMKEFPV